MKAASASEGAVPADVPHVRSGSPEPRPVIFTGDIFRLQARGGVSRYFVELVRGLERPALVLAGFHHSRMLDPESPRVRHAARARSFPGDSRVYAAANGLVDFRELRRPGAAILHPTYYRHPRTLPGEAPVVVTVFDMAHERHPERFRRRWWSSRDPASHKAALCRRAQAIVCISEATRRDLLELLPVPSGKTRVIHLGSPVWSAVEPEPITGLQPPFFVWVGERRGYKNFLPTLEAWAACRAATDTTMACLGGGALRPEERRTAEALGVQERVLQTECSDGQLRWAYEHACGLLYTSLWEGFGLPILEAMSLGCPVVASDRPAIRETAADLAFLVEPSDAESISEGIARCRSGGREPGLSSALVAQGRRFSWKECVAAHESLYRELDA